MVKDFICNFHSPNYYSLYGQGSMLVCRILSTRISFLNIIILIDGKKLTDLAIQYNAWVHVKEHYEVKTVDMDWVEEL